MMTELVNQGFEWVELSHGVRLTLIPGILQAVDKGVGKVASVHNFCPLPVGIMGAAPNLYEPAAPSRRERIMWYSNTMKTLDFASRVGAERVVLHSGRARFWWGNPGEKLERVLEQDPPASEEEKAKAREAALRRMRRAARKPMGLLRECFASVAERAKELGLRLGVENREAFTELPLDEEMGAFLESLQEYEVFGYWHDSGHAQLKEEMGLIRHLDFLRERRDQLVGFHLHDVSAEGRDHQVPGSGVIDWKGLGELVREGDTVVMEMSPRLRSEEIRDGRAFLQETIPALAATVV